jgi:hypothetical protein
MSGLATRLEAVTLPGGAAGIVGAGGLRLTVLALLIWLAIPAIGSLLVGLALLAAIRRIP